VLRYDPVADSWSLEVDASSSDPAWAAADLDALDLVPEPGLTQMLASGCVLLSMLGRRRRRVRGSDE
jgi:hypothetical protein